MFPMFTINKILVLLFLVRVSHAVPASSTAQDCTAQPDFSPPKDIPTIKLHNGVKMPLLSLGTSHAVFGESHKDNNVTFIGFTPEKAYRQIELALRSGIRSFDTALMYGTQPHIGHVLANWWMNGWLQNREDVFITTKVFHEPAAGFGLAANHQVNLEYMSPEEVAKQTEQHIEQCLKELGIGYIDLMLMHWPSTEGQPEDISRKRRIAAWRVLELFYKRGWLRAIGVSNFNENHLQQLLDDGAEICPMVNQIEASPYLQFDKIVAYCQNRDILVQSYSPLGSGKNDVKNDKLLKQLAETYQKDIGQIAFRYLIQKGYAVAFLTKSENRMVGNCDVFDFELSGWHMKEIDQLNRVNGTWGLPSPYILP